MVKRPVVVAFRLLVAALAVAAIVAQFAHLVRVHGSVVNFFSFFTIEANIFALVMLVYGAVRRPDSWGYQMCRGAATTYMTITGVVYALLLSDLAPGTDSTIGWVNWVLHRIMPVVLLVDWLVVPPAHRLRFTKALRWALVPLAYAVYSLVRGAVVHWYPYPFLNVDKHGLGRVLLTCVGVGIAALAFIAAIVALGNLLHDRSLARDRRPPDGPMLTA